jgi:hypothetical protein
VSVDCTAGPEAQKAPDIDSINLSPHILYLKGPTIMVGLGAGGGDHELGAGAHASSKEERPWSSPPSLVLGDRGKWAGGS